METKQGHMHIGAQIQKRVKELGLTNSQFANLINCHRTNVNNIYKSETLDTLKLQRISEVLRFDFFNIMYRTILLHPQMKLFQNE